MERSLLPIALVLGALSLLAPSSAQKASQARKGRWLTYVDATTGVSFRYPAGWQMRDYKTYRGGFSPPLLAQAGYKPKAVIEFTGTGTRFAHTQLESLDFLYMPVKVASAAACEKRVKDAGTDIHDSKSIGGMWFFHTAEGDGSAGHMIETDLYGHYRNGVCDMFEATFDYNDYEGVSYERDLTAEERQFLKAELEAVTESIRVE